MCLIGATYLGEVCLCTLLAYASGDERDRGYHPFTNTLVRTAGFMLGSFTFRYLKSVLQRIRTRDERIV